jgi:hypothetical protein
MIFLTIGRFRVPLIKIWLCFDILVFPPHPAVSPSLGERGRVKELNAFAEERIMNTNKRLIYVLGAFLFLLAGMLITPAHAESPFSITPFDWFTGMMDNGTSKTSVFTVRNEASTPLVIRNIRLKTTSSCFSITPSMPLPATLAPAGEITVEITFTSAGEGLHRASIEVDCAEIAP